MQARGSLNFDFRNTFAKSSKQSDFVCRAVTFFNEIDLHPHNSYHLRNTIKLIRRSSSIIDEYIYSVRLHDIW